MPDVRHLIAECPRKDAPGATCGVYFALILKDSDKIGVLGLMSSELFERLAFHPGSARVMLQVGPY
jgi:hypothetical protein